MKRFLFIHLPKNAGKSLQWSLQDLMTDVSRTILKERIPKDDPRNLIIEHMPVWQLIERGQMDPAYLDNTFVFTCIRNAWDRFRSLYYYKKQDQKGYSVQQMVDLLYTGDPNKYSMWNSYEFWLRGLKQCEFVHYGPNKVMQRNFNFICKKIGIPLRRFGYTNSNQHYKGTSIEFYEQNPGAKEGVADFYAYEIDRFNQTFPY